MDCRLNYDVFSACLLACRPKILEWGGTERTSQTLPPMIEPAPMRSRRPKWVHGVNDNVAFDGRCRWWGGPSSGLLRWLLRRLTSRPDTAHRRQFRVSPITTPVPWSMKKRFPMRAPG
jgi:hypothetical protein